MVIARAPLHVSNSASLVAHTTNPPRLAPAYARLALLARLALIVLFDVGAAAAGALGVDLGGPGCQWPRGSEKKQKQKTGARMGARVPKDRQA